MIDLIVSILSQFVIIIGLYFTFFWVLIMFNREDRKIKKEKFYDISILIPAFNEQDGIEKTINSALNLKYKKKITIYIINDASTDNTLEIIKKYEKKSVIIIDKKKNEGKASALNTGLKMITTPYFAVVDADSEMNENALKNSIIRFQRDDSEKVGAVISKMKPENENGNVLERIQLIEYMMVGLIRSFSSSIRLLHITPGVLSIYNTKLVKKLGNFDEKNMTEDFELGVRIRKSGHLIEYVQNSEVYTTTPSNFKMFLKQRIRWSRGFIQTHKKHREVFFNKKYGLFGIYQFPMNIFGPILYFLAIFLISFKVYKQLYKFLFKLINTPDLINFFQFNSFYNFILGINSRIDLMLFINFILFLSFILGIIKFYDYNFFKKNTFKKILSFILYVMIYNYIYIYVWIVSITKEIRGEKYSWGTKK